MINEHSRTKAPLDNESADLERLLRDNGYSPDAFSHLLECYRKCGLLWKVFDVYRELINNGLDGKERFELEKVLRKEFPFLTTRDLYNLVKEYDLALIQAPAWGINTPPLATASLSSFMRGEGYKVLPLDFNIASFYIKSEQFMKSWDLAESLVFWDSREEVMRFAEVHKACFESWTDYVIGSGTSVIGFTVYGSSYHMSLYLAEMIKKKKDSVLIIFGGPHMSRYMMGKSTAENPNVDLVVDGEGEFTLKDIMERIKGGKELHGCRGTIQKNSEGVTVFEGRELIKDISSLPFPDFSEFDFKQYAKPNTLPMMSSRGCPNRCIYCNEKTFWKRFRFRDADSIFNELIHQLKLHPHMQFIEFHDSVVNGNVKELERLCDLIIEHEIKIYWSGQAVIRKEMDFRLLTKLGKSGCICLAYGLETASTSLMENIGKVFSKGADIGKILEDGKRTGVGCSLNFMFGLPGETEEDFEEVLRFLRRNKDYIGTVNPSPAFCGFAPGTKGYEEPEKYGIDYRHGYVFWETDDGRNNYEVRLKRFETFCQLVDDLKIPTTYPYRRLLNRDEMLKDYYLKTGQMKKALPHLFNLMNDGKAGDNDIREFHRCWAESPDMFRGITIEETADGSSIVATFHAHVERMINERIDAGDQTGASSVLINALKVDGTYIDYYLLLTEIYIKLERFEDALEVLQSLMKERPDYKLAKIYEDKIKNHIGKAVVA